MSFIKSAAILLLIIALTGCTLSVNGNDIYLNDRPALGPTLEKENTEDIDVKESQSNVSLELSDGNITVEAWDRDYIEVRAKERLTAPKSTAGLEELMKQYGVDISKNSYEIGLKARQPEKPGPLSIFTSDVQIKVPQRFRNIQVKAVKGTVEISGFKEAATVDATLASGQITLKDCKAYSFDLSLDKGKLLASHLEGKVGIKAGYADTKLMDIKGDLDLAATSGDVTIDRADGRINCNISDGKMEISDSVFKDKSTLYSTNGDIAAGISKLEKAGEYSFRAARGSISLKMPGLKDFSINAKTDNGSIRSDFAIYEPNLPSDVKADFDPLLRSGSGMSLSGLAGAGGPSIVVYTNSGDITVAKQ